MIWPLPASFYNSIAIRHQPDVKYPSTSPYHPSENYPEYPFACISVERNQVYDAVRKVLFDLGLDENNFGSSYWNPFGVFIKPGDFVLIKPNFVTHFHPKGLGLESTNTHVSIVRAVLDYVIIALQGNGTIILGDAPIQSCRIDEVLKSNGLFQVLEFLREKTAIVIEFVDRDLFSTLPPA